MTVDTLSDDAALSARIVPFSSVVGSSVTLHDKTGKVVCQLSLLNTGPMNDDAAEWKRRQIAFATEVAGCINSRALVASAHNATVAAIARAETAEATIDGLRSERVWLELREPGCVPERKGPFAASKTADTLREFMAARPAAFITVITQGLDGPLVQDGPECLQMLDGRSMSVGRRHIQTSAAAFAEASLTTARADGIEEAANVADAQAMQWQARATKAYTMGDTKNANLYASLSDNSTELAGLIRALSPPANEPAKDETEVTG